MNLSFQTIETNEKDQTGSHLRFNNSIIYGILNEKQIGYIKVTLLTKENFQDQNPTVWHFMKNWKGWTNLDLLNINSEKFIDSVLIRNMLSSFVRSMSIEEKKQKFKKIKKELEKEMNLSIDFFINKPFVNYIEIDPEYRNKGYAEMFYKEAFSMVNNWGMDLYSDSCQTEFARKTWKKMERQNLAICLGKRFKIQKTKKDNYES